MNSYSQSGQDLFVLAATNNKHHGYFLEIGSNHPSYNNNSFLLETQYKWKGLMVEYDKSFETSYKTLRSNSIYVINDARVVNYREILDSNNFPTNMDYLQIDLDVDNKSTLDTLRLLEQRVFDKYKFATITFEHDIYSGNFFDTREISRKIFEKRGYVLAFPDVTVYWNGKHQPFEDWYIHPDLVSNEFINKIKTIHTSIHSEITQQLYK
jgi:hypothetical protein